MKNIQKLALGLLVGIMAIGFSAFNNVEAGTKFTTRYWVNNGTNYTLFTTGIPNTSANCKGSSPVQCAVQSDDSSIPSSFPITDLGLYTTSNVAGSKLAKYQP